MRDLVGSVGRGGFRFDTQPYHDRTEKSLLLPAGRVGEEAGCADGGTGNLLDCDQLNNLETDRVPDGDERGAINPAHRLDGCMGESVDGLGEGGSAKIGPVDKYRVVAVRGDAVVVGSSLVFGGGVLGHHGDGGAGEHHKNSFFY